MKIVKRLSLNKTPKDVQNASIACAKNIMVDDTGSFITNDIGFKESFKTETEKEFIVGVIPCNKEIVIFTHNNETKKSKLYRKPDNGEVYEVPNCNWNWSGGKITGSYTYNYKGQLIIAVGEYDDSEEGLNVPLKSFNLNECKSDQTYAIEEDIPTYLAYNQIISKGSLVCGVYTFFIRFKLDNYNYTKWFQISGDLNITQTGLSKKYVHKYLLDTNIAVNNPETATAGAFNVNTNGISSKGITLQIDFNDTKLKNFQLGFILKRNSEVVGRIQGEYETKYRTSINVVNNNYIEDISIDELLENPHQFFNVKNIVNYNNRLYISNYKEYEIENLVETGTNTNTLNIKEDSNNIILAPINEPALYATSQPRPSFDDDNDDVITWQIELHMLQHEYRDGSGWTNNGDEKINIPNVITDRYGNVLNNNYFISSLVEKLVLKDKSGEKIKWTNTGDNLNLYLFVQDRTNLTVDGAICIAARYESPYTDNLNKSAWNYEIPNYTIQITDNGIYIKYKNKSWQLSFDNTNENNIHISIIGFWETHGSITNYGWYFGNGYPIRDSGIIEWQPQGYMGSPGAILNHDIHIKHEKIESDKNIDNGSGNTPDIGGEDSTTPSEGSVTVSSSSGSNARTIHPYQEYNLFVHYIRKDGSYTLGYPLYRYTYNNIPNKNNPVIIPSFNITNPNEEVYVGYFISYEDIESTVDCVFLAFNNDGTRDNTEESTGITNAEYLYGIDTIRGDTLYINGKDNAINTSLMHYIESKFTYNHIHIDKYYAYDNAVAYLKKTLSDIYNNKVKTLYRFTRNIYEFGKYVYSQEYLPHFYTNEVIIQYIDKTFNDTANGFIIDPASTFVIGFNGVKGTDLGNRTLYNVRITNASMYSKYPMSAMNIKQDYQEAAVSITYKKIKGNSFEETTELYVNCLVSPDKLQDLLELKACYMAKPSKSYTNYNADNIFKFNKTIYRSDVMSDESLVNGFRHFDINNYKNILENKGEITNLVGIGLYFLVHTEYSLFVFDRSPKLTNKSQLEIPDTFDIDYQEVMPSNEGFGGLKDKEESIITKHGYIWYDKTNKLIFCYENGKAKILSVDINNFIKNLNITTVRFAEDIIYSRLIICFYITDGTITLSYSFNTNSFISVHDYAFTNNYRTYGKSYIFDSNRAKSILYEFDVDNIADYKGLFVFNDKYFPIYEIEEEIEEDENENEENESNDYIVNRTKSYVDIIFNFDYENSRVLECIKYVLNEIKDNISIYNIVEEKLNRRFSGDILRIYTDETDSEDLDIYVNELELNNVNNYKLPYFDKGKWNLNYFRNKINTLPTDKEVNNSYGNNDDTVVTDVEKRTMRSDNRSLIYGKYFVIRFIFNNDKKVKLDTIEIATNNY